MNAEPDLDPRYVPSDYNPAHYDRPSVTVDVALFALRANALQVLLIRRKNWPYQGYWAVPGGFIDMDETLEQSARRELREETGVEEVYLEQLYTFGEPARDPRSRVISVAYLAWLDADQARPVQGADDAAEARWWPMAELPRLAFDHDRVLSAAHQRLRWKLETSALAAMLLPETFTLNELHAVVEGVLGERLDRRRLRRTILATGVLEATAANRQGGQQRPARLYRFTAAAIELEQARRRCP
jgi:8-oxo-dGTP diphosphatase